MLHVITGCMFSGKSEALYSRIKRFLIARKRVCIFIHKHGVKRKERSFSVLLRRIVPEKCKIVMEKQKM